MKILNNLKLKKKLFVFAGLMIFFSLVLGYSGIFSSRDVNNSLITVYNDRVIPLEQLKKISDTYAINIVDLSHKIRAGSITWQDGSGELNRACDTIESKWKLFNATKMTEEEKELSLEAGDLMKRADAAASELKNIISGQDSTALVSFIRSRLYQNIDPVTSKINELIALQLRVAKEEFDSGQSKYKFNLIASSILLILILSTSVFLASAISKSIRRPVEELKNIVGKVAAGNEELREAAEKISKGEMNVDISFTSVEINITSKDEIGELAESMKEILVSQKELTSSFHLLLSTINNMIAESTRLTQNAIDGNLSYRSDALKFQGGYSRILKGFNETLDAVISPVKEGVLILEELSKGDLRQRVKKDFKGDHEVIKKSINLLAESMEYAIYEVSQAVHATASAADEISSSSEEMAAGSQEQSHQTVEIAGAIEEMTKTILSSSRNAAAASENSRLAIESAHQGAGKVAETKEGILRIVKSAETTGRIINSLAGRTDQIGEITQVIDDIADQTNLLALNAAIEAARAGEQGRGFAVVADEVRKLAERTTKATKEIADTIRAIQSEARQADSSMNEAAASVEEGMRLTESVALSLNRIVEVNQKVSDIISQVAAASEEESSAAEQISRNIEGITSVVQQSAAGTEQIARAAGDLSRLTLNLQELIGRFHINSSISREVIEK